MVRWNSRTIVVDRKANQTTHVLGGDQKSAATVCVEHGLFSVDDQVEHHLLELVPVAYDSGKIRL